MRHPRLLTMLSAWVIGMGAVFAPATSGAAMTVPVSDCGSGGPGSTSCTWSDGITSCEVSCSSGFYACCGQSLFFAHCACLKSGGGSW
jgi:hypothetical protein